MKSAVSAILLGAVALALGGCGSTMRGYLENDTPEQTAAVRQDLTMPPDLRLPPPGSAAEAPPPADQTATMAATAPATSAAPAPAAPRPNAADSVYQQYGISLYKPDGTKKSDQELQAELRAAYLAKKRQSNPNYGTIANIGSIFSDE